MQRLFITALACLISVSVFGQGPCNNQTSINYNGYDYQLVEITNQCLFSENLRTHLYSNGDPIPGNLDLATWPYTTNGAQTVYGENGLPTNNGETDDVNNLSMFGRLYNFYAVNDERGLCPSGWYVPSKNDFDEIKNTYGGSSVAGTSLKSSPEDDPSWNGDNYSGFSLVPSGYRVSTGGSAFFNSGIDCWLWDSDGTFSSSTSNGTFFYTGNGTDPNYGLAVRCKKENTTGNACGIENAIEIEAISYSYSPQSISINPGETITWTNIGGYHDVNGNINSITGNVFDNPESFYLNPSSGSATNPTCIGSYTFSIPGIYSYDCSIGNHAAQGMVGTITVGNPGCNDVQACNYNPASDFDDGSCWYAAEEYYDCDGNCLNDADGDGVCNELETNGCTDQEADNYESSATDDDGTCEYLGCTNPIAENYDSDANVDDGSCIILGCMDSEAANYNIEANQDDESCLYDIDYVNDATDNAYDDGVESVECPLCPPCDSDCPGDYTGDNLVSIGDLLAFLILFGNQCE